MLGRARVTQTSQHVCDRICHCHFGLHALSRRGFRRSSAPTGRTGRGPSASMFTNWTS
ncbi:30S ribosomal protein S8 [Bifidobacterium myosotis]|uniref:30S ribosomal protein S8 n=1 Tax=Bifidobacterium myosotis TaxID=1630166 RepID=A0A5M9ZLN5_9BIFI|nr:30S ribosomal protein S8 [Bifidobacterium myosotis]